MVPRPIKFRRSAPPFDFLRLSRRNYEIEMAILQKSGPFFFSSFHVAVRTAQQMVGRTMTLKTFSSLFCRHSSFSRWVEPIPYPRPSDSRAVRMLDNNLLTSFPCSLLWLGCGGSLCESSTPSCCCCCCRCWLYTDEDIFKKLLLGTSADVKQKINK